MQEYIEKDNAAILEKVERESKALKDKVAISILKSLFMTIVHKARPFSFFKYSGNGLAFLNCCH